MTCPFRSVNGRALAARVSWLGPPLILLAACLIAVCRSTPASAQVAEAWLRYTPIDAHAGARSTRLEGMGSLEVAVPDDQSLIDPYNLGGNPAALLMSRDTSLVMIPTSYQNFDDAYYGFAHSAVGRSAGFHGEFRPTRRWGMAADLDYGSLNASRHDLCPSPDDCRFIRDFDLPVAPEMEPVTGDRTFGARVSTPLVAVTYARTFFQKATFGAKVGYRHEAEDRRIQHPYDLDVSSDATQLTGGAYYPLSIWGGSVSLSGWGSVARHKVLGKSESSLNEDVYDWDRPQVAYGGALFVKRGEWLRGIVDGRHRSYDGEEIARVNWAPQFYLNPNPSINDQVNVFKKSWSAFLSGLRHNEASTRWLVGLPGKPVHIGLSYAYFRQYEWITPNEVVIPTVDELNVRRSGYRLASGFSIGGDDGKGLVAIEARVAREFREDFTDKLPDIAFMTYTYHFGVEYPVRPDLALRGGLAVLRHDPNRDDLNPALKGAGVTAGVGYFWKALDAQIDLSLAHYHFAHAPADPSEELGFGDRVALTLQRLF
jgi:hypothetical protein